MVKSGPGRMTKEASIAMRNGLRVYFNMGISAAKAALQTGHSRTTCNKVWKEFHQEGMDARGQPWAIRQRMAVTQFESVYSEAAFKLNVQLNDTIGLQQAHKKRWQDECARLLKQGAKPDELPEFKPDNHLEERYTKINKLLTEIADRQTDLFMQPYVDETREEAFVKMMQEKTFKIL